MEKIVKENKDKDPDYVVDPRDKKLFEMNSEDKIRMSWEYLR